MRTLAAMVCAALAACGGAYRASSPSAGGAGSLSEAALPYAIVDGHTGRAVAEPAFWQRLEAARAVCVGEEHPDPHHHWVQHTIVTHLATGAGRRALGLEMVERSLQGIADDLTAGAIDEATFVTRVAWADRWGFPWSLYQPILATARAHRWELRALNANAALVKRVARVGVAGLDPVERAALPELVLDDPAHRAWFDGVMRAMGDHGGGANMPTPDNMYAAQVVRDEQMAAGAADWLAHGDAIVILAGTGHCNDGAIGNRLRRRGVATALTVRTVVDDGEGSVAAAITEGGVDYLWVLTPPPAPPTPAP